jgi:DNA polymerase
VPGEGDPLAQLCFIGEAPGREENESGRPFVGAAGRLLNEMIAAMGLQREQVFITNTVHCRPPMNRKPERDELEACAGYLQATLKALYNVSHVVLLGATAARAVLGDPLLSITRERGKWRDLVVPSEIDPHRVLNFMPTFHPSYLLRCPEEKSKAWADLREVMRVLDRESER